MSRLFVGNFDLESTLAAQSSRQQPSAVRRIVAELAPSWVAIAEEGDVLWCPEPIDPDFFSQLQQQGLPRVKSVSQVGNVPAGLELVPWGWTDEVLRWGRSLGAVIDAPPLDAVRRANSRRFSHRLEQDWGLGLPGAAMAESLPELFASIERLTKGTSRLVVKAEFSNSSRERFVHHAAYPPTKGGRVSSEADGPANIAPGLPDGQTRPPKTFDRDTLTRWAERRLATGQALFVEPWVERVDEAGVQLTIPRNGKSRVEGVTRLLVDDAGHFRGSEFTPTLDNDPDWRDAIVTALDVADALQQIGYFGPLGIDVMRYRDAKGNLRLRPIQDINARWTMGRLSLGLRRLITPQERGYWLFGNSVDELREMASIPPSAHRAIPTSPSKMGGRPARLRTKAVIS